ncbi:hypothetical protein D3C83_206530 [compost metagenome]
MDAARPGPGADLGQALGVDVDQQQLVGRLALAELEAKIAEEGVDRQEDSPEPGAERENGDEECRR